MTDGASGSFPQAPPAPSLVGTVLDGRYRIVKLSGEGGMGEVYAAEHVHIEKRFAIKLLKQEIVSNAEAVTRFRQEARSSSSIGHRNIIAIEDFGQLNDGRIYMCMELLNGAALNDMIQQPMAADRLLNILIQTGHGLAAAHAKGIVHRDMKPENIFVTIDAQGQDVPKILDFGIAKVSGNDGQNHLTRTGTIFGTPFYMAPEQALGNPVDPRTDIYAMGVIMYECFAGSLPFQGESFMGILTQHITTPPEPVAQRAGKAGRSLPMGVAEIITKCMEKDPNARYQTMDDLVNALIPVYRGIAGPGMSTYMEAFPVGSAQHTAQHTPAPMMSGGMQPIPGRPPGQTSPTVGVGTPPPYQSQPMGQPAYGAPSGPTGALGQSGLYDPAASSLHQVPKKSNTGMIIALLVLLAAGGGIAAVVLLGGKKDKQGEAAGGGSDNGSQVAVNDKGSDTGSAKSDTPDPNNGSAGSAVTPPNGSDTTPDTGSNTGSDATPNTGSNTTPDTGSDTTVIPDGPKPISVLLVSNAAVFQVYEGGTKVIDGPDSVEVTPGTPRTFTIKANGYKDLTVTVDGKQKRLSMKLAKVPVKHTGGNTGGNTGGTTTPPPPKMDCSKTILDASSATCRMQYCKAHPNDQRCAVLDDE
jgi:serine/threonine-protein kinase